MKERRHLLDVCSKIIDKKKKEECIKRMKDVIIELKHFDDTGIPRCSVCKKNMVRAIDLKTGKKSKYEWKTNCEHNKNLRLCIG